MPELRVAYLGMGLGQNRKLPFLIYDYPQTQDFGMHYLPDAWRDFAGSEAGIIMTLDDISRRGWFASESESFYGPNRTFQKWMYSPIDSVGPNHTLSARSRRTVLGYDRVLAASEWGCNRMMEDRVDADWLPHGIWMNKFNIIGTEYQSSIIVGAVMANQQRKLFPVAFEVWRSLLQKYGNRFQAWLHTDTTMRYWDVLGLVRNMDYGTIYA
jgi:hypothetical protein